MNQIDRIRRMEQQLDEVSAVLRQLSGTLEQYKTIRPALEELSAYLDSGQWLVDYEADEAGLLPADLKRGVLSQDALYDLLAEHHRLLTTMKEITHYGKDQ